MCDKNLLRLSALKFAKRNRLEQEEFCFQRALVKRRDFSASGIINSDYRAAANSLFGMCHNSVIIHRFDCELYKVCNTVERFLLRIKKSEFTNTLSQELIFVIASGADVSLCLHKLQLSAS